MIGLTLKQLRYFEALARHRHFGRAAEACFISQPALSLQIKELESMFGAPLVERGPRQVQLTAVGEAFLIKARQILLDVDELEDLVRASRGPLAGRLRLGVIPTIAPYLLPEIIASLSDQFPDLELDLRESVTRSLIEDLLEARLDLAIVALPIYRLQPRRWMYLRPTDLVVPFLPKWTPTPMKRTSLLGWRHSGLAVMTA